MGKLKNIWALKLGGLQVPELSQGTFEGKLRIFIRIEILFLFFISNFSLIIFFYFLIYFLDKNLAKEILPKLRAKLRKSVPFNRMKLMIVGLQVRFFL